jgi:hypothetical protein
VPDARAQIDVEYAQYYLTPVDIHGSDADEYGDDDGLVMASDDAIWVECGTRRGQIDLEVRLLNEAPFQVDWNWEAIVERSFSTASGARTISTWGGDWLENVFPVIPAGGDYRLRVHVRGREQAEETNRGEQHLLLIWPAAPMPNEMLRMDKVGVTQPQIIEVGSAPIPLPEPRQPPVKRREFPR